MTPDAQIRLYRDADWPQVWEIFQEVVAAGETYAYDLARTEDDAKAVRLERPPGITLVAADGETALGTAKTGPNRPGPGTHVATASFMVPATARGKGVGQALGFTIIGTVPAAFQHPTHGRVGLHVMHRFL